MDNRVYAFGASLQIHGYSRLLWERPTFLGPASIRFDVPIGVWSTPVADPEGRRLFVVFAQKTAPNRAGSNDYIFRIAALDLDTGAIIQVVDLVDPGEPGRRHMAGCRAAMNLL